MLNPLSIHTRNRLITSQEKIADGIAQSLGLKNKENI